MLYPDCDGISTCWSLTQKVLSSGERSFLVGVWVFFFQFAFSLAREHTSVIHKALKIFIVAQVNGADV